MKHIPFALVMALMSWTHISAQNSIEYEKNWPAWRGPDATGVAIDGNPPVSWSETSNIRWKVDIPGLGHSTPIVWEDHVFVTTAVRTTGGPANTYRFIVLAYDRNDGEILWQTTVTEEAVTEQTHEDASMASGSPMTDGEHLYAYFGSRGLFCLDFQGNVIWERDFGHQRKRSDFGEGDSPALYGNRIVVLWDHEGQSAIYCVDKNTGNDVWKMDRNEPSSWTTPLILSYDGKIQVITAASNRVRSYDLDNGQLLWECGGLTENVIPNPVFADGTLYVMSGYRGNALMAIRLAGAKGDITGTGAILWTSSVNTPYVPSPLLFDGRLYFLRQNSGALSCLDAATGKVNYGGEMLNGLGVVYAAPVAAQDRIYVTGGTGLTVVLKAGAELQVLSQNKLEDSFTASAAVAGDDIYLRGSAHLYCISAD